MSRAAEDKPSDPVEEGRPLRSAERWRHTRTSLQRGRLRVVAGAVGALLVGTGLARADVFVFEPEKKLTAQQLNDSFAALQQQLAELRAKSIVVRNGRSFSVGATFCGTTAPTKGAFAVGETSGYAAAKSSCEKSACGSDSAHMCSSEEVVRSRQAGLLVTDGWYSSGTFVEVEDPANEPVHDCYGWTRDTADVNGPFWTDNHGVASGCDAARPILCCD
jgi:hypothetical protein